jgi:hypothetical protein
VAAGFRRQAADTSSEGWRDFSGGGTRPGRRSEGTLKRAEAGRGMQREGNGQGFFFSILAFLIKIQEMNLGKHFFLYLAILSRVSPSDTTYEEVTPVHLARLSST